MGWARGAEWGIWGGSEDGSATGLAANGAGTARAAPPSLWEKNLEFGTATAGGGNELGFQILSTQTSLWLSDPQPGHVLGALGTLGQGLACHDPAVEEPRSVWALSGWERCRT